MARHAGLTIENVNIQLINASGENMCVLGESKVLLSNDKHCAETVAIVARDVSHNVLVSWHDLQQLGVIPPSFPACANISRLKCATDLIMDEFPSVFRDELSTQPMNVGEMKIHLSPNYVPYRVSTPRQVPLRFQETAEATVKDLIASKVITREMGPTEWCAPAFFVPKPDGKRVRLVTDYTKLNKFVQRPVHPFPSVKDIMQSIPAGTRYFAKMDAIHGYFQLALDEESSRLTTFLLPSGRYRYLRAPMGLSSSSDEWCRHSDRAIEGLNFAKKIVDDVIVWASSIEELSERVRIVARRCQKLNIILSRKKFVMGEEIEFAGFVVNARGVSPDPAQIAALKEFPRPKDITGVRSFLGLANQLSGFVPDFAHMTKSLRGLTGKNASFLWLPDHEQEFLTVKQLMTSSMVITHFDPSRDVTVLTDASRLHGLGFAMGHMVDGRFRLVTCGSKSLTATQQRYSTVELECLGVHYAISKCAFYLKGLEGFQVLTDHRPLEGVFQKDLYELSNPRLQRIREKLAEYTFKVQWVPGKTHYIADALSRAPLFAADDLSDMAIDTARTCLADTAKPKLTEVLDAVDEGYRELKSDVKNGKITGAAAQQLKGIFHRLSMDDELVYLDAQRLVLPKRAVPNVLKMLHAGHGGTTKTYEMARSLYYWPGMYNDVVQMVQNCGACSRFRASQPHTPRNTDPPSAYYGPPMQHVGLDMCEHGGKHYLVCVDHWSGFPLFSQLRTLTAKAVCTQLGQWFNILGWPRSVRTDGGPQFRGDFVVFCKEHQITLQTSAPYNPRSNGLAESAVKTVKKILKKSEITKEDPQYMLYCWRNIPRAHGYSPAQHMYGRQQNLQLPQPQVAFDQIDFVKASQARDRPFNESADHYNRDKVQLSSLQPGQHVLVQHPKTMEWSQEGCISAVRPDGLSYELDLEGKQAVRPMHMVKAKPNLQVGAVKKGNSLHDTPTPSPSPATSAPTPPLRRSPRFVNSSSISTSSTWEEDLARNSKTPQTVSSMSSSSSRRPLTSGTVTRPCTATVSQRSTGIRMTKTSRRIPMGFHLSASTLPPLGSGLGSAPSSSSSSSSSACTVGADAGTSRRPEGATMTSWNSFPSAKMDSQATVPPPSAPLQPRFRQLPQLPPRLQHRRHLPGSRTPWTRGSCPLPNNPGCGQLPWDGSRDPQDFPVECSSARDSRPQASPTSSSPPSRVTGVSPSFPLSSQRLASTARRGATCHPLAPGTNARPSGPPGSARLMTRSSSPSAGALSQQGGPDLSPQPPGPRAPVSGSTEASTLLRKKSTDAIVPKMSISAYNRTSSSRAGSVFNSRVYF
jgi:transposase InsO family protein